MSHFVVDDKDFEDAHATAVTKTATALAADRLHDLRVAQLRGLDAQGAQFRFAQLTRLFAMRAQPPNETLGHDRAHGGGDEERLHAEIDQARDGGGCVVRVQSAEDEMAGEAGVGGDGRGLEVANFSDHDDVRRLAQDGTERGGEGHPDLGVDLHLIDPVHLILDRFLDRDDLAVGFVHVIEAGVERARLARTGRAGSEQDAIGQTQ